METKFTSQICTSREQSERLLALGLKKETADMHWWEIPFSDNWRLSDFPPFDDDDIPAWSMHRLWELANINRIELDNKEEIAKLYDYIIDNIESQIKEGYFNKEYLQEQAGSRREE